jgi:hypothetical protein
LDRARIVQRAKGNRHLLVGIVLHEEWRSAVDAEPSLTGRR